MQQTLTAPAPLRPAVPAQAPVCANDPREPSIEKLRGVPLIATWVVLAGAPWLVVWQIVKHAL